MRLMLEQKIWKELDRDLAAAAPPPHIVIHPSEPKSVDLKPWKTRVVEWNLPADASVIVVSDQPSKSSVEWPVSVIEAKVMRAADVVETRLVVAYTILEYCVAAMWRGPHATLQAERERILTALNSGRPDWRRREIICIAQLYE